MKKFILFYFLSLFFLFSLFYWEISPLATLINLWQVDLTSFLTSFTLSENIIQNNHIAINNYFTLVINKECNGLIPYFFLLASIIAFPSSIIHKVKWALLGYVIISLLNVFRIWFITHLVIQNNSNFSLAHDYLGNTLLVFSALLLFIAFLKTR